MMLMNELLLNEINHGNLSCEDARKMYEMIEKEELIKSYTFPTKPSSDGYYHIYVKDSTVKSGRRQFKSKTLDDLKEKVYQYEKRISPFLNKKKDAKNLDFSRLFASPSNEASGIRTPDNLIKSQVLYRLS